MGASIILDSKVIQRFWKKVDRSQLGPGGCWVWVAAKNKKGYGIGRFLCVAGEKRTTYAHRFSYLLHYGELPPGKIGDKNHLCLS